MIILQRLWQLSTTGLTLLALTFPATAQISRPAEGAGIAVAPGGAAPAPAPDAAPEPGPTTPPPVPPRVTPPPVPPTVTPEPTRALSYFIIINGKAEGPFGEAQLREKVRSGDLVRTALVWTEGMQGWEEAAKVADLVAILASVPPKAEFDAMAYLSGTWQSDPQRLQIPNIGPATLTGRATYRRDGTYSYYGQMEAMMQGYLTVQVITSEGTFTAREQGPGKIVVTPNGQIVYTIQGQTPATEQNNTPFVLTVLDENTVVNDEGIRSTRIGN